MATVLHIETRVIKGMTFKTVKRRQFNDFWLLDSMKLQKNTFSYLGQENPTRTGCLELLIVGIV